jgi:hypothetical protein
VKGYDKGNFVGPTVIDEAFIHERTSQAFDKTTTHRWIWRKKKKINMSHKSTSPLRTMDKPYED